MISTSEEKQSSSEDMFKEIQTKHMIYQINSALNKKMADKMRNSMEEITKMIGNAYNIVYEKKITVDTPEANMIICRMEPE